jgi:hypothetical protein
MNKYLGRPGPRPDSIILHFNKVDSQIARNWSGAKVKDIFDDKD